MPHGLFQKLQGAEGRVEIESLGALIGTIGRWSLSRRGDDGPGAGLYDLHAVLSYVNPHLWDDEDYTKSVLIKMGKELFRVEQSDGFQMVLNGTILEMQGVKLCPTN